MKNEEHENEEYIDLSKAKGEDPHEREYYAKKLNEIFCGDGEEDIEFSQVEQFLNQYRETIEKATGRKCSLIFDAVIYAEIEGIGKAIPIKILHSQFGMLWLDSWSEFNEREQADYKWRLESETNCIPSRN